MTENRKLAEVFFAKIKELGFEPYDVEYGNGYFIFDRGEDSVIHFRLKGVWKHWKFGMWVNTDLSNEDKKNYPVASIFAQYDTQIDKFKPSRSELCIEYKAWQVDEEYRKKATYWYCQLEDMLNMMKKHPLICYAGCCGSHAGYYGKSFIWNFVEQEGKVHLENARKAIMMAYVPYTKAKIFFAKRNKCVKKIELYDFNKNNPGWSTSYLYSVKITFTKDCTIDDEIAWLNRWWRKDHYGKFGYFDHVIELDRFHKEGRNGPYTYERSKS